MHMYERTTKELVYTLRAGSSCTSVHNIECMPMKLPWGSWHACSKLIPIPIRNVIMCKHIFIQYIYSVGVGVLWTQYLYIREGSLWGGVKGSGA